MQSLTNFHLPAPLKSGSNCCSLTGEETETQRGEVSAEDHTAPGQENVLPLPTAGETGLANSLC